MDDTMRLVEAAEAGQHDPAGRRALLDPLGDAVAKLAAAGETAWLARALIVIAEIQIAERLLDEAATAIAALARVAGDHPLIRAGAEYLGARIDLARGQPTAAAVVLERLVAGLDRFRTSAPAFVLSVLITRVAASSAAGSFTGLERALADLTAAHPAPLPIADYHRGLLAEARGQVARAIACHAEVVAGSSDPGLVALAHLALARLQPGQAGEHLARARAAGGSDDPDLVAALARVELAAGRYGQARALAERLHRLDPDGTLPVQAEILAVTGPPELARRVTARLLAHATAQGRPGAQAQAYLLAAQLGETIEERGFHAQRALALADRLGDSVTAARARLAQGFVELDLGDLEAALSGAERAAQVAAEHGRSDLGATAELLRGLVLHRLGAADAAARLERALEAARRDHLLGVASRALHALDRPREAQQLLDEAGYQGGAR